MKNSEYWKYYHASTPEGFVIGLERTAWRGANGEVRHRKYAHLYKGDFEEPGWPMCRGGWNREDGAGYSIWRGNAGEDGVCPYCKKRAIEGKQPVAPAGYKGTMEQWIRGETTSTT